MQAPVGLWSIGVTMPPIPTPGPKLATTDRPAPAARLASAPKPGQARGRSARRGSPERPTPGAAHAFGEAPTAMPSGDIAMQQGLSSERQELLCSVIGLAVKVGLVLVAGVSLARLATAYQERMERQGELAAVLDLERAKLAKARERFDHLFMVDGEQRLIREQNQWIAPNRLRVVWQSSEVGRSNP